MGCICGAYTALLPPTLSSIVIIVVSKTKRKPNRCRQSHKKCFFSLVCKGGEWNFIGKEALGGIIIKDEICTLMSVAIVSRDVDNDVSIEV